MVDVQHPPTHIPRAAPPVARSGKPKKDRANAPPSPPLLIRDASRQLEFQRLGFLGEGGFARVYEAQDEDGRRLALKAVSKANLRTEKTKTKLYAEIKLHKMMDHPNIVGFNDCFDDDENVYMGLELCDQGSMMDMLRRRKRLSEPEVRFWLVQLIGACSYMHGENVIHRDLKLGNIFLDDNFNVKVGDFGLAALIEKEGDRKKTICGTPNYIAPEVLFDTANGHSFEVDVWSIGVILYTLIIGMPPFQTKEIKAIYKRIKENNYEFPPDKYISPEAKDLIINILTLDPRKRPTLETILAHPFFITGPFPASLPSANRDDPTDFEYLTPRDWHRNFTRAKRDALEKRAIATSRVRTSLGPSVLQQEREFQRAVQPDSPLSALLSSARQPLLIQHDNAIPREPLIRKLSNVARSSTVPSSGASHNPTGGRHAATLANVGEDDGESDEEDATSPAAVERQRELDAQKARIMAEMASSNEPVPMGSGREGGRSGGSSAPSGRGSASVAAPALKSQSSRHTLAGKENKQRRESPSVPASGSAGSALSKTSSSHGSKSLPTSASGSRPSGMFDAFSSNLDAAFEAKKHGQVLRTAASAEIAEPPLPPSVFIVSWLDYCNKYGMGYALTDGSVGVHFNDSSSIVLAPDREHFDYISSSTPSTSGPPISDAPTRSARTMIRRSYTLSSVPIELETKVYLLKHFKNFMTESLSHERSYCFVDTGRTKGLDFVQRYLRMKHVIVFKLSHDVLQFNFYDHTKLVLSSKGLVVTFIDKDYQLSTHSLSSLIALAVASSSSAQPPPLNSAEERERRTLSSLIKNLNYVRILLDNIRTGSSAEKKDKEGGSSSKAVAALTDGVKHRASPLR